MKPNWADSLREKLDDHYVWPARYTFKFIVPQEKVEDVKRLFPKHESVEKKSKNENYASVTLHMMMPSSSAVIDIYNLVSGIEGIIAL